jgi:hypothetical protein
MYALSFGPIMEGKESDDKSAGGEYHWLIILSTSKNKGIRLNIFMT